MSQTFPLIRSEQELTRNKVIIIDHILHSLHYDTGDPSTTLLIINWTNHFATIPLITLDDRSLTFSTVFMINSTTRSLEHNLTTFSHRCPTSTALESLPLRPLYSIVSCRKELYNFFVASRMAEDWWVIDCNAMVIGCCCCWVCFFFFCRRFKDGLKMSVLLRLSVCIWSF